VRYASAPAKEGEDYRPLAGAEDAVEAFMRNKGATGDILKTVLSAASVVPKEGGLVSQGSVDRTVYDHAGYSGKEDLEPRLVSQEPEPSTDAPCGLVSYPSADPDTYLGTSDHYTAQQKPKPAKIPEEPEDEADQEPADQAPPWPGQEWDPASAWNPMMPGMMPPWGGMMTPEMMGMMPPPMDPAMYAMWYQHTMMQQAWAAQNMMGMPANVPPYPAPAYAALGADQIEEETIGIPGNVWKLAKTSSGSRRVQDALDAADDIKRMEIADEMKTHVREAYRCPHANHVIQKCITTMPPVHTGFILVELNEGPGCAVKVARHKFGCRVLQRLFEHCSPEQVQWIVEELLLEAVELSKHAYANFVLQHVLEHATDEHKTELVALLTLQVATVAEESNGSAVLQKAMEHANDEAKVKLSHALISQPDLLAKMACSRHGHLTAKKALEVAEEAQRNEALFALRTHEDTLKSSRYGRVLFRYLEEKREEQDATPTAA